MTTGIIIVSHALTQWNLKGVMQGHTDVPLNAMGRHMADWLAKQLAREKIHGIYTSDLVRAVQTAAPLAREKALDIVADTGLREGRTFRQQTSPVYPTLPFWTEMETRPQALKRITETVTRIARDHDGQTILLVTHAGVLDLFINCECQRERARPFRGIRTALNRLVYDAGYWRCIELNRPHFLNGPGIETVT